MSNTIDLTLEDSPPRSTLTLPRGVNQVNANATPTASSSGSGRNSRQTVRERNTHRGATQQTATSTSTNNNTTRPPNRTIQPSASDDGFELTGMSEGARLAAERAQRQAEEARRWRHDFLISQRGGGGSSSSSTSSGVHPSPGIRIHDGLPPGPHAEALAAWLPQMYAQINPSGDYSDPSSPTGFPIPDASAIGEVLRQTGRMVSSSSLLRGGRSGARGRGGAATRGRGASIYRSGISADYRRELEKLIPPKHDPRFVLNHNKRQPDGSSKAESTRKGFSFGIVEPPLDVETFDQDPRIIRGPLPDTSPICAGCDCALVLDGSHQRRIWALPCGHVIDGRCYTRYCHGVTPARARELAREEVKQSSSINAQSRQQPSAGSDPNKDELTQSRQVKITEHFAPGTKRSLQESADSQTEDEEADADISKGSTRSAVKDEDFSSWPTASLPASRDPDQPPPSKRTRVSSKDLQGNPANQASATHATLTATAPLSTDGRSAAAGRDAETGAAESRVVKTFVCPVEGCSQRCNTTPHKAASAIELYV